MADKAPPAVPAPRTRTDLAGDLFDAFERSSDGVLITNPDGVIEYANSAFVGLTGYSRGELIGKTPAVFSSGVHGRPFYEEFWSALRSGQPFRSTFVDRKRSGELVHLEQTSAPVTDADGHITRCVASARDVTARVRADAAVRRLNEVLEDQARTIAERLHDEAGQLLTAAYIALADAALAVPALREPLERVRTHLDSLEEQLRHLAHELRPLILDDLGLVPAIEFLAAGVAKRWSISVSVEGALRHRLPRVVEATVYRFAQEALTNVARHAQATSALIKLEHEPRSIRCIVQDDGVGFDAGVVLEENGRRGIGLAGVRERVTALGGSLQLDSIARQGTVVTATIPVENENAHSRSRRR